MQDLIAAAVPDLLVAMGATPSQNLIDDVVSRVHPLSLEAGDSLFAEGDPADAVYLVVTGRLLVVDGDGQTIRKVGRGEIVGEIGLLEGSARTAGVRADRDSILARLPHAAFDELAARHPDLLREVARTAVGRLLRPRRAGPTGSVAVVVLDRNLNSSDFVSQIVNHVGAGAATSHLTKEFVDSAAGVAGTAMAERGSDDALRREAVLSAAEADCAFAFLEMDEEPTAWTGAALRRADRVLLVVSSDMSETEEGRAGDIVTAAWEAECSEVWMAVGRSPEVEQPSGSRALAERFGVDRILHFRIGSDEECGRLARLVTGTGIGLVLGGGGARGFAHLGVYRALLENDVSVDAVAGASIGGILGAVLSSGVDAEDAVAMAQTGFAGVLDYTLPIVSLVKGSRITRGLQGFFGDRDIEDLVLPFLCVSTNLTTSTTVVHAKGPIVPAVRAGLAIPGVIPPVPADGELLVDGGVLANVPVGPLRESGMVGTVIAVDVAPPRGPRARGEFGLSVSGWKALGSRLRRQRRYPSLTSVLMRSMIVGSMDQLGRTIDEGHIDLLLRPHLRGVSLLAFDDVETVVEAGYQAALPEIEAWLGSGGPQATPASAGR